MTAHADWTVDAVKDQQMDVFSATHLAIKDQVLALSRDLVLSEKARTALTAIAGWNGHFDRESKAAYLYYVWLSEFAPRLFDPQTFELWQEGRYIRVPMEMDDVRKTFRHATRLGRP